MVFILFIIGLFGFFYLNRRITKQQREIDRLSSEQGVTYSQDAEQRAFSPQAHTHGNTSQDMPRVTPVAMQGRQHITTPTPSRESQFVAWMKRDFMVKVGALLLLIGFGWFVSYAFANNWIGPVGRIMLGLLAGLSILVVGEWRVRTYLHQGSIFVVLGSATILLTVFAARHMYDFFSPFLALVLMFLSVAFVTFVSLRYRSQNLAFAGLVLASVAPLLTNSPAPDIAGLFSYILMIVLGTLWVVYYTGWKTLTFAAFVVVFLYGLPFLFSGVSGGEKDITLLFAFVFTTLFFVGNILSIIHRKDDTATSVHFFTAVGTGLYLIAWVTVAAPEVWRSLLFAAWMVVFAVGAFLVYMRTTYRSSFYIYGATSMALLAAATAAELNGPALTIAYTIEAGFMVVVAYTLLRDITIAEKVSLLFIGPLVLSFESIVSRAWNTSVFHGDFFVLAILILTFGLVGVFFYERIKKSNEEDAHAGSLFLIGSAVYTLILIWLVTHVLFANDAATMLSLIVYTIIGLTAYISGKINNNKALRLCGGMLLGGVVLRLLLVEVWQMELTGRIITFCVIGTLLISTAFVGRKQKVTETLYANDNQPRV